MNREELDETMGYLSGQLNDALGTAQDLESNNGGNIEFVELRKMIEVALNYCDNLLESL